MPAVVGSARWVAAQRARESQRIDRIFFDPLAPALSGEEGMAALQLSEKCNPRHEETANYIAIRTRFNKRFNLECAPSIPRNARSESCRISFCASGPVSLPLSEVPWLIRFRPSELATEEETAPA